MQTTPAPVIRPSRRAVLRAAVVLVTPGLCMRHHGAALAQTAPPPEVAATLREAQWSGSARLRFFGLSVYDANLWVAPSFRASAYAQHAFAIELRYLRQLKGAAIAERSLTEMRRVGSIGAEQASRWLARMQEAFPDVVDGDRIVGIHTPGVGAQFWVNGQLRATVADPEFAGYFFGIWLSESTSEPAMRSALLARAAP
jgi:hypothetical protein